MVIVADAFHVDIHLDTVEAIGLYKLVLGLVDEETEMVSAALQVELSRIVGP